mgnify:CR=1 FL=1
MAIVVPSLVSLAGVGLAVASARSWAVVVSNWATVRAAGGGDGDGVGSNVAITASGEATCAPADESEPFGEVEKPCKVD